MLIPVSELRTDAKYYNIYYYNISTTLNKTTNKPLSFFYHVTSFCCLVIDICYTCMLYAVV